MVLRIFATVLNALFVITSVWVILTDDQDDKSGNGIFVILVATLLLNSCLIWS